MIKTDILRVIYLYKLHNFQDIYSKNKHKIICKILFGFTCTLKFSVVANTIMLYLLSCVATIFFSNGLPAYEYIFVGLRNVYTVNKPF